jgi:hypothetical protein
VMVGFSFPAFGQGLLLGLSWLQGSVSIEFSSGKVVKVFVNFSADSSTMSR